MPKKEKEKNSRYIVKIASRPSDVPEPNSNEAASTTPLGSKTLSVRLQEGLAEYGVVAAVT